jgi:hypothetical protein
MKKLSYLAFCLVLVAGFGCAITDYGIITDNNQSVAGQRNDGGPINTAGKAHIIETSQVATIWSDGTDELFSFVDQASDGTGTITTYNNFSTGSEPTFHSDLYCNASWSGCAIWTAPDDNDANSFDGAWNQNCSGSRSLSLLLGTGRYYGECGKDAAKLSVSEKIGLLDSAVAAKAFGRQGLMWNLDSSSTTITVRNLDNGLSMNVPFFGARIEHFLSNNSNVAFTWMDHAMLGVAFRNYANLLDNELNSESLEISISHHGITSTFTVAGGGAAFDSASAFRFRANTSY